VLVVAANGDVVAGVVVSLLAVEGGLKGDDRDGGLEDDETFEGRDSCLRFRRLCR
jgi:hypothetical protein